jgi:hypothetical protein
MLLQECVILRPGILIQILNICRSALDLDYCVDFIFRGANERVGLEHCTKD